jgi:uncharacterized protein with HEPN domain
MSLSDDRSHLFDMLKMAEEAVAALEHVSAAQFRRDRDLRMLTQHRLLVFGEAARRLSDARRESLPAIPFIQIIALRNVIVHRYDKLDALLLHRIVKGSLPATIESLRRALEAEGQDPDKNPRDW